jgi:hypothetical protein
MRKFQFAFCHHLDKIAQAELIAKVPSDTQEDHLSVEMTPRNSPFTHFRLLIPITIPLQSSLYPSSVRYLHQSQAEDETARR